LRFECVLRQYLAGNATFLLFVLPIAVHLLVRRTDAGVDGNCSGWNVYRVRHFGTVFQTEIPHARSGLTLFWLKAAPSADFGVLHRTRYRLAGMVSVNARLFETPCVGIAPKMNF